MGCQPNRFFKINHIPLPILFKMTANYCVSMVTRLLQFSKKVRNPQYYK